jgi:hypothetical protein
LEALSARFSTSLGGGETRSDVAVEPALRLAVGVPYHDSSLSSGPKPVSQRDRLPCRALVLSGLLCAAAGGCSDESTSLGEPGAGGNGGGAARCPPGEAETVEGGCEPAGVPETSCAAGFEPDGARGCRALLPPEPCASGAMALLGETTCRPVATCGTGAWGDVPVEANTEFVDASYLGGTSDGSQANPWTTLQAAIDAAEPGAIVAVAAGSYAENLQIGGHPVRLWGRCPDLVEIVGSTAAMFAAIDIRTGADGTEIRNLAIRGPKQGIALSGSTAVVVDSAWIHDTGSRGLNVQDDLGTTSATLQGSLLERNSDMAVFVRGGAIVVERSVVRDVRGTPFGRGLDAQDFPSKGTRASVTVRFSVFERAVDAGILVIGSDLELEGVLVRDTLPASDGTLGDGITLQPNAQSAQCPSGRIRSSVVEASHNSGIVLIGGEVTLETSVVRDTLPQASDQRGGRGVVIQNDPGGCGSALATIRASSVERNTDVGILVVGSEVTIDATLVRQTASQPSDQLFGRGVAIQHSPVTFGPSTATVTGCRLEGNRELGLVIMDSAATVQGTVVAGTLPLADGRFGDGLAVASVQGGAGSATLDSLRIEANARAGIANFGAAVAMRNTILACNAIDLDGEPVGTLSFAFEDQGGNGCGCAGAPSQCQVSTAALEPPGPVAE